MTKEFNDAGSIVREAAELVGGERARQHGDKLDNFTNIARIWSAYLKNAGLASRDLEAHEAADLMELLKVARRQSGGFNPDDYIDGAGYAGVAYEARLEANNRKAEASGLGPLAWKPAQGAGTGRGGTMLGGNATGGQVVVIAGEGA